MPKTMHDGAFTDWDVNAPHVVEFTIGAEHIDHMAHVNNAVYLTLMEQAAWSHTRALGLSWQDYQRLDAGVVVRRHELDYLAAAHAGERVQIGTWISGNDQRLQLWRGYQIRRPADNRTLLRAHSRFVCVKLSTGRPRRMPPEFVAAYVPLEP